MSSFSHNLKNKMKLTFRRKEFWSFSDFEFNFSKASDFETKFQNASDFDLKVLQCIRFWTEKYNALDFELKNFGHVRFWKNVCIQKITYWFNLLRENDLLCIFGAFLKSMILNSKFQNASDFVSKVLQRARFGIQKKHIFKVVLNASCFPFKKTQNVTVSIKIIQPLRDELTGGSFQLCIWRLNL